MTKPMSILFIACAFIYSVGICLLETSLQNLHVTESVIALIACVHNLITCSACAYIYSRRGAGDARCWWAASFIFVGVADVLHGLLRWVHPFAFRAEAAYAADNLYTIILVFLAIACLKGFMPIRRRADKVFLFFVALACCLGLTFGLTMPLMVRGFTLSFFISDAIYNLVVGVLTGILLLSGLRTRRPAGLIFVSSFLLVLCSDFAIRSYDYMPEMPQLSIFNYGWELGFSFISVTGLWLLLKTRDIGSIFETIPKRSIRYDIAVVSLGALCLFALIFIAVGHGSVTISTADISILLLAFLLSWTLSNASALWVSTHISNFKVSMGHGKSDVDVLGIEIAELMKAYRLENTELAKVLGQVKQHKEVIEASLHHIAHDMRSHLAVLKGYTLCTVPATDEKDGKEFRSVAERSVAKLLHMTDEIVECAKAVRITSGMTDIAHLLHEQVLPEVRLSSVPKTTLLELGTNGSAFCNVDTNKIGRALVNIITNAAQAIDHDQGRIAVAVATNQDNLTISVSDNGRGIPPENLSRVFDEFFTSGKKTGTGLGLAYCKQVVEAHGGTIEVQSEVGKGTTFTINIPNCVMQKSDSTAESYVCTTSIEIRPSPGSKNILVVDDDAEIRAQWKRIIDDKGGQLIYTASSVEEVRGSCDIDYSKIDMAIVDYSYEGSSETGIDLISFLKQKGVEKVHLCTGFHDDADIRMKAVIAGAQSIIPKPLNEDGIMLAFENF